MHLGLTPWNFNDRSAQSLARQAQIGESLGYESFWLPESHFTAGALPDPLMLLAAAAAGTETIQLGTTSYLLPMRNPLLAAEQVAVLDQLSAGRVLLGVGRGFAPAMLRAFDVAPREKRARFEANLDVMMRAWAGEPIAVEGADEPLRLDPLPVQQPHPPVWVAAFGPKALAQAGRLGLPYLASPMETLSSLRANFEAHGRAAVEAGHGDLSVRPIMRTVFIGRSRREVEAVRQGLADAGRPRRDDEADVDDWALVGDRGHVAAKFDEYQEVLGATHIVVTRLRIGGIAEQRLMASIADVLDLF
ncbi:MAG: LLM class flavin-dependent oxidoreductase [Gammaproteobacteria bacterium]|nr:LLM class flavin-dependent oxidoreductase [Gammaproteobacteria bacterium]